MAGYQNFRNMKVWKQSRKLNQELFEILKDKEDRNFGFLKNHMFKTAGSIMDNIAEGSERSGNKEFIHFLSISKGSVGELISQLYRAMDAGLISESEFKECEEKLVDISKQLMNFMKYLKQSDRKGAKFEEPQVEYQLKESTFYDAE
jgi:four helix bundle protein